MVRTLKLELSSPKASPSISFDPSDLKTMSWWHIFQSINPSIQVLIRCMFCKVLAFLGQAELKLSNPQTSPSDIFYPSDLKMRSQWLIFKWIQGNAQIHMCDFDLSIQIRTKVIMFFPHVTSKLCYSDLFSKLIISLVQVHSLCQSELFMSIRTDVIPPRSQSRQMLTSATSKIGHGDTFSNISKLYPGSMFIRSQSFTVN